MSMRHSPFFRKRTRSIESIDDGEHKRLRRLSTQSIGTETSMSMPSAGPSRMSSSIGNLFLEGSTRMNPTSPSRSRISGSSSFIRSTPISRASSMTSVDDEGPLHALMRSASSSDLRRKRDSMGLGELPTFKEHSAFHNVRPVNSIDYSDPVKADATEATSGSPIGWSQSNALVFGRGNRVYHKTMTDTEGVAQQLTKLNDSMGNLRLVQCAGKDQPNMTFLATSSGHVQLWDLAPKKVIQQWKVKDPSAVTFNGAVLTVGDGKGTLRHYDTRTNDSAKMRDQAKKVTRHQGRVTALAWSRDGNLVSSGDQNGLILVWDVRKFRTPLEVGEMVQRRRKMQHVGAITALAWCPWFGKYLVSGDSAPDGSGTLRVWDISNDGDSARNSERPTKLELDAQITSLHFSPHINELLSTHGPGKTTEVPSFHHAEPLQSRIANSIVVHQFPLMRHVTTVSVAKKNVAGSVLSPNGQRIVLAIPEESQLRVWDVWGKFKVPKQRSMLETSSCMIR